MNLNLNVIDAHKLPKLPQWAQRYVGRLQNRVDELEDQLVEMSDENATDLFWSSDYDFWQGIPNRSTIRISIDDNNYIEIFKDSKGKIRVSAGFKRIIVIPSASNCFYMDIMDY